MRFGTIAVCCALAVSGCADDYLLEAERQVVNGTSVTSGSSLNALSLYGWEMSAAYRSAARETITTQDVQSFLVFLAAGSFVTGAVGSASDAALANRAIAGAAVQQIGGRTAPRSAIQGMYVGAKRLNCIASVAKSGQYTLPEGNTQKAASALVFGAIEEVRITTRESLVREIADYDGLVTAITPARDVNALTGEAADAAAVAAFSTQLTACLAKKAEKTD